MDVRPPLKVVTAVSGGSDSVAMFRHLVSGDLCRDWQVVAVAHLDHETRGDASAADAGFVRDLAARRGVPCHVARFSDIEPNVDRLPSNRSARFRATRHAFFAEAVRRENADAVAVAHHADDQAETVLLRLLRGGGAEGLRGMSPDRLLGGLRVVRPVLETRRETLRGYLQRIGQPWREDVSNSTPVYARNRVRTFLADRPHLVPLLLSLARGCGEWADWLDRASPTLRESFDPQTLVPLPLPVARRSARRWMVTAGISADALGDTVVDRLLDLARRPPDRPRSLDLPDGIRVTLRRGRIGATRRTSLPPASSRSSPADTGSEG